MADPTSTLPLERARRLIEFMQARGLAPQVTFVNNLAYFEFADGASQAAAREFLELS